MLADSPAGGYYADGMTRRWSGCQPLPLILPTSGQDSIKLIGVTFGNKLPLATQESPQVRLGNRNRIRAVSAWD
ncbi:MAG: hypothetical protein CMJ58_23435 [Planctomycetaceae bacterium]|nr:hypothetical protein [Planctomycetaceae bacterium]